MVLKLSEKTLPKVSVFMMVYNHEKFIKEALNGVLMQKCNFDYEIVIGEDYSTDESRNIILEYSKQYPGKFKLLLHNSNIGAQKNQLAVLENCTGQYIALCEGDDYWTDPLKLQKQVDFLEGNQEYSICWTKYKKLKKTNNNSVLKEPEWINSIEPDTNIPIDLDNIFTPYCTLTLTCMFRDEALDVDLFKIMQYTKDNTLYALCLTNGKGMLLDFYGAVYRLHNGGVYSNATVFNQKYFSYLNIKEILTIPECNNKNIRTVKNYLLIDSLIYLSRRNIFKYICLFRDLFSCFGIKKTITIFLIKIKGENLTRKHIG
jgi:glycosyltransferase involved in cell wall biosynthesis